MLEKIKFLYRAYRYRYKLDPGEIKFIIEQVKEGDIAVDIGGHKGGYLYWLSKKVGPTGKVYVFEPQPILFQYLQRIQKFTPFQNTQLENYGVSQKEGQFDFFIPTSGNYSSPGATLNIQKKEEEACNVIQIKTVALDAFFEKKALPNFLKIDVEGHEMQVLKGAEHMLNKNHPTLLFECEQRHQQEYSLNEIFDFLKSKGYQGFFVHQNAIKLLDEFKIDKYQIQGKGEYWKATNYCNNFIFMYSVKC